MEKQRHLTTLQPQLQEPEPAATTELRSLLQELQRDGYPFVPLEDRRKVSVSPRGLEAQPEICSHAQCSLQVVDAFLEVPGLDQRNTACCQGAHDRSREAETLGYFDSSARVQDRLFMAFSQH